MVFFGNLFITGGCGHMIIYFFSKNLSVFTYLHTKSMAFTVCEYCMWVYLGWWPPYNPMWPPLFPHEFLIFDVWVASNIPSSDSIPQNSPNYGCFNMNFLLVESHHDVFILYPPWYPDHIPMSVSENRLFDAQESQGVLVRGVFDGLMVMNPLFLMGTLCFWWAHPHFCILDTPINPRACRYGKSTMNIYKCISFPNRKRLLYFHSHFD